MQPYVLWFWKVFLNCFFDYFLPSIFSISEIPVVWTLDFLSWSSKFLISLLFSLSFPLYHLKNVFWFHSGKFPQIYIPTLLLSFLFLLSNCIISKNSVLFCECSILSIPFLFHGCSMSL